MSRPEAVAAQLARGRAALGRGDFAAAVEQLEAARRAAPEDPGVLHALAGAYLAQGRHAAAEALLEEALGRDAGVPGLWHGLALVHHGAGRYRAALAAYERAASLAPRWAPPLAGRGKIRQILGDPVAAERDFRAALALDPADLDALSGLAAGLELKGANEEALGLLTPVVEAGRAPPAIAVAWSRLAAATGTPERAEALLRRLLAGPLAEGERGHALFALGDVLDRRDACAEAFDCYAAANALKPGQFDAARWASEVAAIAAAWTPSAMAQLPPGVATRRPVFIVGLPRSGTTLVEQVLAAHDAVHGAGELTALDEAARTLGTPPTPAALAAAGPERLAAAYLEAAGGPADAVHVTDKMPANFRHLGLIRGLFPRARIIHCRRDLRDVALSCFRQDFSGLGLAWSRRLEDIGAYFAGYRRLMAHWEAVLGEGLTTVAYEEFVAAPEAVARRLVEGLALPWDPGCLRFFERGRVAVTASHAQVREPIHSRAVGGFRRYEKQLAPLARWLDAPGGGAG
jgi:tetratricopeptide (TPR) repeat protein